MSHPSQPNKYLDTVIKVIEKYEVDVFIPGSEGESRLLAVNKISLEKTGVKLSVLSGEKVDIITD